MEIEDASKFCLCTYKQKNLQASIYCFQRNFISQKFRNVEFHISRNKLPISRNSVFHGTVVFANTNANDAELREMVQFNWTGRRKKLLLRFLSFRRVGSTSVRIILPVAAEYLKVHIHPRDTPTPNLRGIDAPTRYSYTHEVHLLYTWEVHLHTPTVRVTGTPLRYSHIYEVIYVHLRETYKHCTLTRRYNFSYTPTKYSNAYEVRIYSYEMRVHIRSTATPSRNSSQIRPQVVRKFDASTKHQQCTRTI